MSRKPALPTVVVILLSTALLLCIAGSREVQVANASPYTSIDVGTAYDMVTNGSYLDLVVLDVRAKSEYDSGHIYGAVLIPHTELEARIAELSGHENHEIIVYCLSGGRSATASGILDSHNFTKVYNMLGGITAWQSAGYPVWIATIHNLNTTFNYDTIQTAIDAPQTLNGHMILVDAGIYYEHVTIDKSISLIGENRSHTIMDGNGTGSVIEITANLVNITGFTIRNGTNGIFINDVNYTFISGNTITNNEYGINLATCPCPAASHENTIRDNILRKNERGMSLGASTDNMVYHNNFIENTVDVWFPGDSTIWDDGYPSGGNYWSNYAGTDVYSGSFQNETGRDKIGDIPYILEAGVSQDNYPLIYPYGYAPGPDANEDGTVDIVDLVLCAIAFGSQPGDPNWNPIVDLNQDGNVDIVDIVMIAIHFGET